MFLALRFYRRLLMLMTYLLPWLAFQFGYLIWARASIHLGRLVTYPRGGHVGIILIATLVWVFMAERYRVTGVDELFRERTGAKAVLSAVFATSVVLLGVLFFSRDSLFPRGLFVIGMLVLIMLAVLMRAIFRTSIRQAKKWVKPSQILVIGADAFAHQAAERLRRLAHAPCTVAAYVCLPGQEPVPSTAPVYNLDQLSELDANHGFSEAVIAIHPAQFGRIPSVVQAMEKLSLPARAIVDLGEGIVVRERLFQMGRMQMLDLTATPADSLDYALLKRAFDIGFALVVLLLTAPLFLIVAILIRLTSPGPVFFVQDRVGLNGKTFQMYKFRTMRVAPKSESDALHTSQEDPRRTPIGILLRKTSFDELPQFYNVLMGNMSVVGPRPELVFFAQKFLGEIERYNHRHWLKVGITGWAQVNGWRGNTSIEKRIQHDLYYLQNWSMGFDLRIIALTISSALIQKNAY
jgi:Undecaprenyl-phosphate glucose phosphotransferase